MLGLSSRPPEETWRGEGSDEGRRMMMLCQESVDQSAQNVLMTAPTRSATAILFIGWLGAALLSISKARLMATIHDEARTPKRIM